MKKSIKNLETELVLEKAIKEKFREVADRSLSLTREILGDTKRYMFLGFLFHIAFFLLGLLWGLKFGGYFG